MKNFRFYVVGWVVLVTAFNIVAFAAPAEVGGVSKYSGLFWPVYACLMLSCIIQFVCTYYAFKTSKSLEKLFLNMPLITISLTGVTLSALFGILALSIPSFPTWIGIIVSALMLAFVVIAVLKAAAGAEIVESVEQKTKAKTAFFKSLTAEAASVMDVAKSEQSKAIAKKVFEAIRYSDPVSSADLADIESQIAFKFGEFKAAVNSNSDSVEKSGEELLALIQSRNNKCKAFK